MKLLPFLGFLILAPSVVGCADEPPPGPSGEQIEQARIKVYGNHQPCFIDTVGNIPIKFVNGTVYIPAAVNGVETLGTLDTGASETFITPELAAAAKIIASDKSRGRGVTGSFPFTEGSAAQIVVGDLVLRNTPHIGVYPFAGSKGVQLGINIGSDFLRGLDYDIDFANEAIRAYRISSCSEFEPPWPNTAARLDLTVGSRDSYGKLCEFCSLVEGPLISLPVHFRENDLEAVFDTGSAKSLMSFEGALYAGATRRELDADPDFPLVGISSERESAKVHRFAQITVGRNLLNDQAIPVRMHFDRRDPPMIMGMDLIGRYHIWLSYSTSSIFIDTGIKRGPVAPLDKPHMVGATTLPIYPSDGRGVVADMDVMCWVESDGNLTGCEVSNNTAGRTSPTRPWNGSSAHRIPMCSRHTRTVDRSASDMAGTYIYRRQEHRGTGDSRL